MKQLIPITLVIAALVAGGVLLFGRSTENTTPPPESKQPIKIGVSVALSSYGALDGSEELRGIQLAVDEVNAHGGITGRPVQLIIEDNQSDIKTQVTVFQKLATVDRVSAVLGPTYSEFIEAIVPAMLEHKIVSLASCVGASRQTFRQFGPYSFVTAAPEDYTLAHLSNYMKVQRQTEVALLTNINYYSESVHQLMKELLQRQGFAIVAEKKFQMDEHDFRTALLQAQQKGAQAYFFPSADTLERGNLAKQMVELGIDAPLYTDEWAFNYDLLEDYSGVLEEKLFFPQWQQTLLAADFQRKYREKYNDVPKSNCAIRGYDAGRILAAVLQRGATTGEEIQHELTNLRDFQSAEYGDISFDQEGIAQVLQPRIAIYTISRGQFVPVENSN